MKKVLTSVALLTVIAASSAKADFKDFLYKCTPGALRACASLQVFTTLNISGGTDVRIRVRNLAGQLGPNWADNTGGSVITRIGIVVPLITGANNGALTVTTVGSATSSGNPFNKWFLRNPGGLGAPIELTAGLASGNTTMQGGITGCLAPASGNPASRFTTCGGWVEFTFSTSNAWSANNSEVAWLTRDMVVPVHASGTVECGTDHQGTPGNPREWCTSVTPEPVTMLLLGSGLAGMGGFGVLRRRKGLDVQNN